MTREEFIRIWLGNPETSYTEQFRDLMRDDLDKVLQQYAEQEAKEFVNWAYINHWERHVHPTDANQHYWCIPYDINNYGRHSTSELYLKFKEEQK